MINEISHNPGLKYYYKLPLQGIPQTVTFDICVYGGTPAGVSAAIQASRMGKTVALAVFRRHVGGMTSGGLTEVDLGNKDSIGGIAAEFYNRLGSWSGFSPSAAENTFRAMLDEAGVTVYYEHRLNKVIKTDNKITAITFENKKRIEAKVFIDASYEGDLFTNSEVCYHIGRENNSDHDETVNGFQISPTHQFRFPVDPYQIPGDPDSGLLPGITDNPVISAGTGDDRVQAYNFRMWAVTADEGIPWPQPAGYNRNDYALLLRYLTTAPPDFDWDFTYLHGPVKLNLGDCNNAGPFSTDLLEGSYDWAEADYETREEIFQKHITYQQGLMYFLANDDEVPEKVREYTRKFALPRNEFMETNGWPHELYIREGCRMVSGYAMTEHNCTGKEVADDSIGLASYTMDSHHCQRIVKDDIVVCEGCIEKTVPKPYPVSYDSIIPWEEDCTNILVPVCLSATHMAYGSIRMEPVFMILGQSAATAASLAIDAKVKVQDVNYKKLRKQLLADGQILDW
jgi:hypothetical protein